MGIFVELVFYCDRRAIELWYGVVQDEYASYVEEKNLCWFMLMLLLNFKLVGKKLKKWLGNFYTEEFI